MYTVCYVITDDGSYKIYQELILSVESLVLHGMPAKVIVLTEQKTIDLIGTVLLSEMEKRNVEVRIIDVPTELSQVEKSRFIKTSLRDLIDGDFLFIDTDTIIVRKLPEVISNASLAMVHDYNRKSFMDLTDKAKDILIMRSNELNLGISEDQLYFNSGAIWARDTEEVKEFFNRWHECYLKHKKPQLLFDQYSLNYINHREFNLISNLDNRFNVQINQGSGASTFVQYLGEAVILHYMHETHSAYIFTKREFRQKGVYDPEVRFYLENPYKAFNCPKLTPYDFDNEFIQNSLQYRLLEKRYRKHIRLFRINEWILNQIYNLKAKIQKMGHK